MSEDHAGRAREYEAALDWEGAEAEWEEAARARHPDAREGIARARKATLMTHELCRAAAEFIDQGELRDAVQPLRAAIELSGEEDPVVAPIEQAWRDRKRDITTEQRSANRIVRGVGLGVGLTAAVALALFAGTSVDPPRLTYMITTMIGMAIGGGAAAIVRLFYPVLKRGSVARMTLKRRRPEPRPRGGKLPRLRASGSRIARWKRAAERERRGGSSFWD